MRTPSLLAGVAQIDITPPVGLEMGGFGRRVQPSVGVHDPLFAKALLLDDGHTRVVIVSCDLLGFSYEYDQSVREAIASTGVVEAGCIMVACTHNHAGPATQFLRNCGNADTKWPAQLRRRIVKLVEKAAQTLRPVTAGYCSGRAGLNYDRRQYPMNVAASGTFSKGERDTKVSVVQFKSGDEAVANLLHYACHPVTMLWENRKYSAEFCGGACTYLERETGAPTLFLNGACANVNPLLPDSSGELQRVTNYPGRDYSDVLKVGQKIGEVALRALKRAEHIASPVLGSAFASVEVPLDIPSFSKVESDLKLHKAGLGARQLSHDDRWVHTTYLGWAMQAREAMREGRAPLSTFVSLQKISIGELVFVGVGGELFAAIGKRIQKIVGAPCLVVGYANGNVGYLPTRLAFAEGGYEVDDASRLYSVFGVGRETESIILERVRRCFAR